MFRFNTGIEGEEYYTLILGEMSFHGCKTESQEKKKEFSFEEFEMPSDEFHPLRDQNYFGQWQEKETLQYFIFIYHHLEKFATKSSRKSLKIFKQMSKFISTRNSSQCRTHHQNNISKFQTLQVSIQEYIKFNPKFLTIYNLSKDKLSYFEDLDFCQDTSTVFKKRQLAEKIHARSLENDEGSEKRTNFSELNLSPAEIEGFKAVIPREAIEKQWQDCQDLFNRWVEKLTFLTCVSSPCLSFSA